MRLELICRSSLIVGLFGWVLAASMGCEATESHRRIETQSVASAGTAYSGPRYKLAIGKFENRSPYQRGIFSDGEDRLGMQARQILKTHLSQSGRFALLDRVNMDEIAREAAIAGRGQRLMGGQVVLTGAVTEFGRKTVGTGALGGVIGSSKKQVAYAKVQLSIVDTTTSEVVYSTQGSGEYQLKNEHVLGFGSSAGYDSTLNEKVLNLAMIEAVDRLVEGLERGAWHPAVEE